MSTHHTHEVAHEATHEAAHQKDRRVAVLISALAAFLAIAEMAGKDSQNTALISNQDASNLWAFFQAKTIRMTTVRTAAEELEATMADSLSGPDKERMAKQIASWKATSNRYNDEPETGEGRKQLAARAKEAEAKRDRSLSAYHKYEYASAAFQIAIVLASASVITGMMGLAFMAAGLGVTGIVLGLLGWLAPTALFG